MRYICHDCETPCCLDIGSSKCYKVMRCPIQGPAHWKELQEPTEEEIQEAEE